MNRDKRIILFEFAGREENLEIQKPYIERLLATYPNMEVHLWDLTRKASDAKYIRTWEQHPTGRIKVMDHFHTGHPIKCRYPNGAQRRRGHPPCTCMIHKPPYESPYIWYAHQGEMIREKNIAGEIASSYFDPEYGDAVFVKIDDDVLFLETDRFDSMLSAFDIAPNAVVSANVINNAVCAKYDEGSAGIANAFAVGDPANPVNDKRWWWLHTNPEFARYSHERFLSCWQEITDKHDTKPHLYVRTRPGEAVSINCISFTFPTMQRLAAGFNHGHLIGNRLGDEGAVDKMLPHIALNFHAGHLTFGPQDKTLSETELSQFRDGYRWLAKEYLS